MSSMSSSDTAAGVRTPKSVNSRDMYSAGHADTSAQQQRSKQTPMGATARRDVQASDILGCIAQITADGKSMI